MGGLRGLHTKWSCCSLGKFYAAICATPAVCFSVNPKIMAGVTKATSYPAFHGKLGESGVQVCQRNARPCLLPEHRCSKMFWGMCVCVCPQGQSAPSRCPTRPGRWSGTPGGEGVKGVGGFGRL